MSGRAEQVTAALLRGWQLPSPGDSKHSRGDVLVIGGASGSPGAAMLAGLAALRVGAGRLTLAVDESVAPHVGVAVPECGVIPLGDASLGAAADGLSAADAVLLGPGLDDPDDAERMLEALPGLVAGTAAVVLDAFALGVAPRVPGIGRLRGRMVMTPNKEEAARLLESGFDSVEAAVSAIASRYGAVVSCYGVVGHPDGRSWSIETGGPGLATSGSGDVLAGAITGLCARGASVEQAAVWGTWLHAMAGDALPFGFLARELLDRLPGLLAAPGIDAGEERGKLG